MEFDLGGAVRLVAEGDDELLSSVVREMDPYLPMEAPRHDEPRTVPTVHLERLAAPAPPLAELLNRAGDGFVTGSDGHRSYVISGGRRASYPDAWMDEPSVFAVEPGFPVGRLFRSAVRSTLQIRALSGGAVAIHASAVDTDAGVILVAGWSESGKTEAALALAERGARFVSDKWTLLSPDGPRAIAFPIGVGVRRWALRYLPRLHAALPTRARWRLAAASVAAFASSPARGGRSRGPLAEGADRAVALADRAALRPSEIAAAYGHPPVVSPRPVRLAVVLRTIPGGEVRATDGDAGRLAIRLAHSASVERQPFWALHARAAFAAAAATAPDASSEVVARETALLTEVLSAVPLVEVSSPFPGDPRLVADALEPWLKNS